MKWYHLLACFFAGAFLANAVPHFVHGVSGDPFPSPFANPPGKGLSSPTVNVLWGFGNFLVGYLLLRLGKISHERRWNLFSLFVGVLTMSIMLSVTFAEKMH